MGQNLSDIGFSNVFFDMTRKTQTPPPTKKPDNVELNKNLKFCASKDTVCLQSKKKKKSTQRTGEKIFKSHIGLISKTYRELLKLNNNKKTCLNGQRT